MVKLHITGLVESSNVKSSEDEFDESLAEVERALDRIKNALAECRECTRGIRSMDNEPIVYKESKKTEEKSNVIDLSAAFSEKHIQRGLPSSKMGCTFEEQQKTLAEIRKNNHKNVLRSYRIK